MPVTIGGSGPITGVTSINTTVSDTELGYLDGVTSALQTQINAKAADSSQGLYLITPTSIANSGGSASASGGAVTFSGVTSVSLNGVFSSTYQNYRILLSGSGSGTVGASWRLRGSGTDSSGSVYDRMGWYVSSSNSGSRDQATTGTSWLDIFTFTVDAAGGFLDILRPFDAAFTTGLFFQGANTFLNLYSLTHKASTSYDGISLIASTGNITGTIRVYGYKN